MLIILPFGCQVGKVDNMGLILKEFLKCPYHDGIPWKEVLLDEEDESEDKDSYVLKVFVVHL
jgi:hypothetical protein